MIETLRKTYNSEFSNSKYLEQIQKIENEFNGSLRFRIAETPLFLPKSFENKLREAGEKIIDYILSNEFEKNKKKSIPEEFKIAGQEGKPNFLAIDFAICKENNELTPKLIELQGFPSLFGFQHLMSSFFGIEKSQYFHPFTKEFFLEKFKEILIGDENSENCILLEIEPEKQKTKIDFDLTHKYWGIKSICISQVFEKEDKLFYESDGKEIEIKRIYNRIILEELNNNPFHKSLKIDLTKNYKVKWLNHPNWFFYVSKHCLPYIKGTYFPKSFFLDDTIIEDLNLKDFVLKPLFSFAGQGVDLNPNIEKINGIKDKSNYILQQKVEYFEGLLSPKGEKIKSEIRLLYLWDDKEERPKLCSNLVRLSKNTMMGTGNNLEDDWVGASIAYFENL